jgi:CBS domain-containing protein
MNRMEREFPTCQLSDSLKEAKRRAQQLGFNLCPVVNEQGIVLGVIREEMWKKDQVRSAEEVMEPGPTTFRPSYPVDDATEFLDKQNADAVLVTSSDGKLLGIFKRNKNAAKDVPKSEIWA